MLHKTMKVRWRWLIGQQKTRCNSSTSVV